MKPHNNVANLIKSRRIQHPNKYSQKDLTALLGLKNTIVVERIEKAERPVPLKIMTSLSSVLNISDEEFMEAAMKDYEAFVEDFFDKQFKKPALFM